MAKEYLLTHPKVLIEVSQKLQQREQQEQAMKTAVIQHQTALTNDKEMQSFGPANAKVTVVEFFDDQYIYCVRLSTKVMKANPQV